MADPKFKFLGLESETVPLLGRSLVPNQEFDVSPDAARFFGSEKYEPVNKEAKAALAAEAAAVAARLRAESGAPVDEAAASEEG